MSMSSLTRAHLIEVSHEVAVVEAGLRQILARWPEFELIGPGPADGRRDSRTPDLLIVDHEQAFRRIAAGVGAVTPTPRLLVVAMNGQEANVRCALEQGVRGYVLVDCGEDEIVKAARAVAAGHRHLCAASSLRLADRVGQPSLTVREGEVLSLVMRGQSNKDMARALGISIGTVKAHMRTLFSKLGARCRTEALWIASEQGLITRPTSFEPA